MATLPAKDKPKPASLDYTLCLWLRTAPIAKPFEGGAATGHPSQAAAVLPGHSWPQRYCHAIHAQTASVLPKQFLFKMLRFDASKMLQLGKGSPGPHAFKVQNDTGVCLVERVPH
jgi:hypothetical protein